MRAYPRRRNGDEYYPRGGGWVVDGRGREVYARDRLGNELYPRDGRFARDAAGEPYYARDALGNEVYPKVKDRSVVIRDRPALYADGGQKYPSDASGNEYYLRGEEGRPILMRRTSGEAYLARNRNGQALIPWNHLSEFISEEPHVCAKDVDGNNVYVNEALFPPALKALIRCICHISILCPRIAGCNTRFY